MQCQVIIWLNGCHDIQLKKYTSICKGIRASIIFNILYFKIKEFTRSVFFYERGCNSCCCATWSRYNSSRYFDKVLIFINHILVFKDYIWVLSESSILLKLLLGGLRVIVLSIHSHELTLGNSLLFSNYRGSLYPDY